MMVDVSYQMVLSTLQTVGLLVGIAYYVMSLRNQQKNQKISLRNQELTLQSQKQTLETRQAQVFRQLFDRMTEREFREPFWEMLNEWTWTDFNDFQNKYGREEHPDEWEKYSKVTGLFEQIGLFVRDELISPKLVWHWIGPYPIQFWEKFLPIINELRLEFEEPLRGMYNEWFEDLVYILVEEREKDLKDYEVRLARRKKQREASKT